MGAKVDHPSLERVLRAQKRMVDLDGKRVSVALEKCGHILLRESQKLVPVDTGNLKESGKVEKTGGGFRTKVFVKYEAFYAVYVHENLEAYHEPPTCARFISRALPKVRGTMTALLRRDLMVDKK